MIVLDASVAIKLITREPGAEAVLIRVVGEVERIAPDWFHVEVANALAKKVRNDGLSEAAAAAGLTAAPDLLTDTVATLSLLDEAFALSMQAGHAVYDCLYLVLAVRTDAIVLTADAGMARAAKRVGLAGHVELIG
ncbi:type II toxin-antitoxin system VapC family toxin [Sphingomonas melonis]